MSRYWWVTVRITSCIRWKHNDFMFDKHPVFEKLGDALANFFGEAMS